MEGKGYLRVENMLKKVYHILIRMIVRFPIKVEWLEEDSLTLFRLFSLGSF